MKNIFLLTLITIIFCVESMAQNRLTSNVFIYQNTAPKEVGWENAQMVYSRELTFNTPQKVSFKLKRIKQYVDLGVSITDVDTYVPISKDSKDQSTTDRYIAFTKEKQEINLVTGIKKDKLPPIFFAKIPKMNKLKELSGIFLDVKNNAWIDTLYDGDKIQVNQYKKVADNVYELTGYTTDKSKLGTSEPNLPSPEEAVEAKSVIKTQVYSGKIEMGSNNEIKNFSAVIDTEETMSVFGQKIDTKHKEYYYVVNSRE